MADDRNKFDDGLRRSDGLSDLIKGAISTGVKTVFTSEEGLRAALADFVPKEVSAYVKTQVDGVKKELYATLVNQFSSFLQRLDLGKEVRKALAGMRVVVKTEVSFVDDERAAAGGRERGGKRGARRAPDA
jgi:hypothetical protein